MRTRNKPPSLKEYPKWLESNFQFDHTTERNRYNLAAQTIKQSFQASPFWTGVRELLQDADERYRLEHQGYELVVSYDVPELDVKSFDSFFLKSFRKNVLDNKIWPSEPAKGWVLPNNWFARTTDIVRTCFLVSYFDGVKFLADRLEEGGRATGLPTTLDMQAKFDGYYGAHLSTTIVCDVPRKDWKMDPTEVEIEIQVTSRIQYMIRQMLHKHYEKQRVAPIAARAGFEWDHTCGEFATTYLGHTLHYLEGIIVDLRDRHGANA